MLALQRLRSSAGALVLAVVWTLVIVTCTGPGPSGDCATRQAGVYPVRWDCRLASITAEMKSENVRAYCQRGRPA